MDDLPILRISPECFDDQHDGCALAECACGCHEESELEDESAGG